MIVQNAVSSKISKENDYSIYTILPEENEVLVSALKVSSILFSRELL